MSEALVDRLRDEGFSPWRDEERLVHGEKWHRGITRGLLQSHAGVVFLARETLKSEWVRKEADFLNVRAAACDDFKMLVIDLDTLSRNEIDATGYRALELHEDQLVRVAEHKILDTVVSDLADIKQLWRDERPDGDLLTTMTAHLKALDRLILIRMAKNLGSNLADWFADGSVKETVAREVARLLTSVPAAQAAKVIERELLTFGEAAYDVQSLMEPFSVNGEAALCLARTVAEPPPTKAVGFNAEGQDTGALLIQRASGYIPGWRYASLDGVFDPEDPDDLLSQVKKAILQDNPGIENETDLTPENIESPYLVLITGPVKRSALEHLQEEIGPHCYFVLWPKLKSDSFSGCGTIRMLTPLLTHGEEQRIRDDLKKSYDIIKDGIDRLQRNRRRRSRGSR